MATITTANVTHSTVTDTNGVQTYHFIGQLTASAADTLPLDGMRFDPGTQIVGCKAYVEGTASSTVSLGDATDATRYINAVSTASSGFTTTTATPALTSGKQSKGVGYVMTSSDKVEVLNSSGLSFNPQRYTGLLLTVGGASVTTKLYEIHINYIVKL